MIYIYIYIYIRERERERERGWLNDWFEWLVKPPRVILSKRLEKCAPIYIFVKLFQKSLFIYLLLTVLSNRNYF